MEEQVEAAGKAVVNRKSKELYTITKMLIGERRLTVGVKDKHGTLKLDKHHRIDRYRAF